MSQIFECSKIAKICTFAIARMKIKKILLLDEVHPEFPGMLQSCGFSVETASVENEMELMNAIIGFYGLVVRSSPKITSSIIDAADELRFIARAGSGIESIDYEHARRNKIEVIHSPEGNRDAVGEHALALTICLLKKIVTSANEVSTGIWQREQNRGTELMGKTVGIIGYGNTGSAFASKLSGMNVEILAYDKYRSGFSNEFVTESTLSDIQQKSDIISFHVPLTKETKHYADKAFFKQCKKSVLLLNTSRGAVVSLSDLADALRNGKVFAAGLDVLENETYHFSGLNDFGNPEMKFLLNHPSVIITPHIAGITRESSYRHATVLCGKITKLIL